jgi:hypothetical protein
MRLMVAYHSWLVRSRRDCGRHCSGCADQSSDAKGTFASSQWHALPHTVSSSLSTNANILNGEVDRRQ